MIRAGFLPKFRVVVRAVRDYPPFCTVFPAEAVTRNPRF